MKTNTIKNAFFIFAFIVGIAGLTSYLCTEAKETKMIHSYGIFEEEQYLNVEMQSGKYYIHRPYKNYLDVAPTIWVDKNSNLEVEISEYENIKNAIMISTTIISMTFVILSTEKVEKKKNS